MIIRSYRVCRIVSEGYANQHITGANQRNQFRTWLVCVLAFFEGLFSVIGIHTALHDSIPTYLDIGRHILFFTSSFKFALSLNADVYTNPNGRCNESHITYIFLNFAAN
ncbi:hypothetical protein OUZ56_028975 [Daphnia magna]|uniref:Uncharacterized protein n=1 Tax=Daphnia magna TaxID=35525 RepID=A0ABR0B5H3_9CRUS|nr:hypothetical protein OUZ56_028975 [Daphnia magna]